MTRWVTIAGLLGILLALLVDASPAAEKEPFREELSDDPLTWAALVARVGDGAVRSRLRSTAPVDARLVATRLSPFLRSPEDALADLAVMAASRDPDLAPAAAIAAHRIARALDGFALARNEVDGTSLAEARKAFCDLADLTRVRADVRRLAVLTCEQLRGAGVP